MKTFWFKITILLFSNSYHGKTGRLWGVQSGSEGCSAVSSNTAVRVAAEFSGFCGRAFGCSSGDCPFSLIPHLPSLVLNIPSYCKLPIILSVNFLCSNQPDLFLLSATKNHNIQSTSICPGDSNVEPRLTSFDLGQCYSNCRPHSTQSRRIFKMQSISSLY